MKRASGRKRAPRSKGRRSATTSISRLLSGQDRPIIVQGKNFGTFSGVSTPLSTILLNPNNFGSKLVAHASIYQEFRFLQLAIKIHSTAGIIAPFILGYFKTPPTTTPSALNDVYQAEVSRLISGSDTVPQVMVLGPRELVGNVRPFFNCKTTGGGSSLDYSQGALIGAYSGANNNNIIYVEYGYIIEFRGPTDPAAA